MVASEGKHKVGTLGGEMSPESVVMLFITIALMIYLVYALLRPEKF